ncbi:hypothetical protein BDB00DRAFT_609473 [Zychaea mexicana]|uniref:uncharacterized protein n=1 Tax=Zychaea mexicana TaxID=64656 RepID=UPI0022FEB70B|nr:uncharacterized protein BDB00DRAFT_609473 [Zychaea mexicana]KAI9489576.1 hypothetical protein BDB00DRAFT_609473 [Zychaea mexicana]
MIAQRSVSGEHIRTHKGGCPPLFSASLNSRRNLHLSLSCPQASVPDRTYSSTVPTNKRNMIAQRSVSGEHIRTHKGGCPPLFSASLNSRRNLHLSLSCPQASVPDRTYSSTVPTNKRNMIAQRSVSGEHIRTSLHTLSLSVFEEDQKPR